MKKIVFILLLVTISAFLAYSDVYIKSNTHTGAVTMMGQKQPAKDEINEWWIGKNVIAVSQRGSRFIIDLNKLVMINDIDKTYFETALPINLDDILPPEAKQMASMMKMTITVNPNGQKKKIGIWDCAGYDITFKMMMGEMKGITWATEDVHFDWNKFGEMYSNVAKLQFMEGIDEFKKIKGFQVATDMSTSIMGAEMKVTSTVLEISKKPAPAGTYSVPAGYNKKDKMTMPKMGGK